MFPVLQGPTSNLTSPKRHCAQCDAVNRAILVGLLLPYAMEANARCIDLLDTRLTPPALNVTGYQPLLRLVAREAGIIAVVERTADNGGATTVANKDAAAADMPPLLSDIAASRRRGSWAKREARGTYIRLAFPAQSASPIRFREGLIQSPASGWPESRREGCLCSIKGEVGHNWGERRKVKDGDGRETKRERRGLQTHAPVVNTATVGRGVAVVNFTCDTYVEPSRTRLLRLNMPIRYLCTCFVMETLLLLVENTADRFLTAQCWIQERLVVSSTTSVRLMQFPAVTSQCRRQQNVHGEDAIHLSVGHSHTTSTQNIYVYQRDVQHIILRFTGFYLLNKARVLNPRIGDEAGRFKFFQWLIAHRSLIPTILSSGKATFTQNCINNKTNQIGGLMKIHAQFKNHWVYTFLSTFWWSPSSSQNMSVCIPLYPAYVAFLENEFPLLLEVPLGTRMGKFFQHDGVSAQSSSYVMHHLNQTIPERWISHGGPVHLPPRYSDLSQLFCCLEKVYTIHELAVLIVHCAPVIKGYYELREATRTVLKGLKSALKPVSRVGVATQRACRVSCQVNAVFTLLSCHDIIVEVKCCSSKIRGTVRIGKYFPMGAFSGWLGCDSQHMV
ncbi:hypothetical protein PR048_005177 [Dryococelus australis]|uniref:Uncharacterized protein n=1 Tax=Dryococelus australis TaxID=614101 RepID=A0ABQ9I8D6_9NEOP|nr:hypothetical protein PR048_005177 [Dryococelus australis]